MFGKPGAGKGTLTLRLAQKYDILTLSTGDILRQQILDQTEVGKEAEAIIARGGLLPDDAILKVVSSKLDALQNKHWILDGFPRTIGQAELLNAHLKNRKTPLTLVVNLAVPDNVILSRISDRWIHLPSGRVYNMSYNRPMIEGFDDVTGEPLTKRSDDNPEVFARRLASFYASTSPLLSFFKKLADSSSSHLTPLQHPHQLSLDQLPGLKVKTFSGTSSDEIWPHLDSLLRNTFPSLKERLEKTQENKRREAVRNSVTSEFRTDSSSQYD
jgi:adenylate kinase